MFSTVNIIDSSSATIREALEEGSRTYTSGDNPSATIRYRMTGFSSSSDAYQAVNAYINTFPEPITQGSDGKPRFHGLPCTSITVSRRMNGLLYDCTCTFSNPSFGNNAGINNNPSEQIITDPNYTIPAVEDTDWSYGSSLTSSHVEVAMSKIAAARYDGNVPIDFGLYIGPNSDGTFEGADRQTPTMSFSITRSEPPHFLNAARRVALGNLTGCVNAQSFAGFGPRNLLFAGFNAQTAWLEFNADGATQKHRYWRVSYNFEARPTAIMQVGSSTLSIAGWDSVSRCDNTLSFDGNGTTIWQSAQVDQLCCYPQGNFAVLGLAFAD